MKKAILISIIASMIITIIMLSTGVNASNAGDCIENWNDGAGGYGDYDAYTSCINSMGWDAYADCAFLFAADVRNYGGSPDQSGNDLNPTCYQNLGDAPLAYGGFGPDGTTTFGCSFPGVICDAAACNRIAETLYNNIDFGAVQGSSGCAFATGSCEGSGCGDNCERVQNPCLYLITADNNYDELCVSCLSYEQVCSIQRDPPGDSCVVLPTPCCPGMQCVVENEADLSGGCCNPGETWDGNQNQCVSEPGCVEEDGECASNDVCCANLYCSPDHCCPLDYHWDGTDCVPVGTDLYPTAIIDVYPDDDLCVDATFDFEGHGVAGDGVINGYEWSVQKYGEIRVAFAYTEDASYTFTSQGSYTIYYKVSELDSDDTTDYSDFAEVSVNVVVCANSPPTAYIDSYPDDDLCVDDTFTFEGHAIDTDGTIAGYTWTRWFGGSSQEFGYSTTASYTFGQVGSYDIDFEAVDNDGDNSNIPRVNVDVIECCPPVPVCSNRSFNPSFEQGRDAIPPGPPLHWDNFESDPAPTNAVKFKLGAGAYAGQYVMSYTDDGNAQGKVYSDGACVVGGTSYVFRIRGRGRDGSADARLYVKCLTAHGVMSATPVDVTFSKSDWTQASLFFTAPATSETCQLGVGVKTPGAVVYFDDAVLYEDYCGSAPAVCDAEAYWADISDLDREIESANLWSNVNLVAKGNEYCQLKIASFSLLGYPFDNDDYAWTALDYDADAMEPGAGGFTYASVPWNFSYYNVSFLNQFKGGRGDSAFFDIECPPSFGIDCCDEMHECTDFCNVCEEDGTPFYEACEAYCIAMEES